MPQNAIMNAGGVGSLFTGAILYIINLVNLVDVNDLLVTVTTLGGAVWMGYKIVGQRLDNKIKKNKLNELERDNTDN